MEKSIVNDKAEEDSQETIGKQQLYTLPLEWELGQSAHI